MYLQWEGSWTKQVMLLALSRLIVTRLDQTCPECNSSEQTLECASFQIALMRRTNCTRQQPERDVCLFSSPWDIDHNMTEQWLLFLDLLQTRLRPVWVVVVSCWSKNKVCFILWCISCVHFSIFILFVLTLSIHLLILYLQSVFEASAEITTWDSFWATSSSCLYLLQSSGENVYRFSSFSSEPRLSIWPLAHKLMNAYSLNVEGSISWSVREKAW